MKKNRIYIGLFLAVLLISACKKDETDPALEEWKQQNEVAFNNLANDPSFTKLEIPGGVGYIYYRVIERGDGKRIYYNSRAEVYYKGWYVVTNSNINKGAGIEAGKVFDQRLFDDGVTFKLAISTLVVDANGIYRYLIQGWNLALQYMVEGDIWEVWIPYRLAYGEEGNGSIPGYSTLAFEIELVKAIDPDEFEWSNTGSSSEPYYY